MTIRRVFLAILVTVCLLALVGLAPVSIRAQYDYSDKVLAIEPTHLVAYWPMNEVSGIIAQDISGHDYDGLYSGVSLDQTDGAGSTFGRAGLWDGINDQLDIFSSGLAGAFDHDELTVSVWIKVSSGVWSDSSFHQIFTTGVLGAPTQHAVIINKRNASGEAGFEWRGSGTIKSVVVTGISDESWIHLALTVSKSADEMKAYWNGTQTGTTQTSLPTWSGTISDARVGINLAGNGSYWSGYIQHLAIWDIVLSESGIGALANTAGLPTPTPTPTAPTSTPTPTLEFGEHIILSSGQVGAFYYTIDTGSILLGLLLLLQVGLLLALLALRMWRRA